MLTSFSREVSLQRELPGYLCDKMTRRHRNGLVDVVLGLLWGDEGKGRFVDYILENSPFGYDYQISARFNGGANAGHTVIYKQLELALHALPTGALKDYIKAIIGSGCINNPPYLLKEIETVRNAGARIEDNLMISFKAPLIMPYHIILDYLEDAVNNIGTTGNGIGPGYREFFDRTNFSVKDLLDESTFRAKLEAKLEHLNHDIALLLPKYEAMQPMTRKGQEKKQRFLNEALPRYYDRKKGLLVDVIVEEYMKAGKELRPHMAHTERYIRDALDSGERMLAEGAQSAGLDVYLGTRPFTTSSICNIAGVMEGLGVAKEDINEVIGVIKAIMSRVGHGPFITGFRPFSDIEFEPRLYKDDMPIQERAYADIQMSDLLRKINNRQATPEEIDTYLANRPGAEFGATTGRRRALGWLDIETIKEHARLNSVTMLAMTKLDIYEDMDWIKICTNHETVGGIRDPELEERSVYKTVKGYPAVHGINDYPELPRDAKKFIREISNLSGIPVRMVSTGPADKDTIYIPKRYDYLPIF